MLLLLRKDLMQAWRSFRFPALVLTAVFFAILEPLTARYMPEILSWLAEELEGLLEILPQMGPVDAMISFLGDLTQVVALVLIVIAMGAVALERERGITAWVLSRPVGRGRYIWSKFYSLVIALVIAIAAAGALVITYTGSLLGPVPLAGAIWTLIYAGIYLKLILAVTVAASTVFRSQLAAGGTGIAFLFLVWLPGLVLGDLPTVRYFPHTLAGQSYGLLTGQFAWTEFLPAAVATLVLANGLIALSVLRFRRAEI